MTRPRLTAVRSTIQTAEAFMGLVDELCVNHREYEPGVVESSTREDFINSGVALAHGVYDVKPLKGELLPITRIQADKTYAADGGVMLDHTIMLYDFAEGYNAFSFLEDFGGAMPLRECFKLDRTGDVEKHAELAIFKQCIKYIQAARVGGRLILRKNQELWGWG